MFYEATITNTELCGVESVGSVKAAVAVLLAADGDIMAAQPSEGPP